MRLKTWRVTPQTFHDHLNSLHPGIQFIVEEGMDGSKELLLNAPGKRKDILVCTLVLQKKLTHCNIFNFHTIRVS